MLRHAPRCPLPAARRGASVGQWLAVAMRACDCRHPGSPVLHLHMLSAALPGTERSRFDGRRHAANPPDACPPAACCAWHSVTSHCPLRRWSLPRCVALCRSGVRAGVFEHRTEGGLAHGGATPCRTGNRTSSGWLCGGRRVGGLALLAPAVAGRAAAAAGRDPKGSLLQPTPPHLSLLSNPNARHTHRCSAPLPAATARAALPQAVATAH